MSAADLEELGLIASPAHPAGRIPTARGYRVFVDTMLTARPAQLEDSAIAPLQPDQPQRVIASAAHLLSNLSHFVGVVTAPRRPACSATSSSCAERRVPLILVAADGDVQNRVLFTAQDHTACRSRRGLQLPQRALRRPDDRRGGASGCRARSTACAWRSPR